MFSKYLKLPDVVFGKEVTVFCQYLKIKYLIMSNLGVFTGVHGSEREHFYIFAKLLLIRSNCFK
jgi:hypothetical protein